jgi:hypothetical protein
MKVTMKKTMICPHCLKSVTLKTSTIEGDEEVVKFVKKFLQLDEWKVDE